MAKPPAPIKIGNVVLPIAPHVRGWRVNYKDADGKWKFLTNKDPKKLAERARAVALRIQKGAQALDGVTPDQAALLNRVLKLGITHADLDVWEATMKLADIGINAAVDEFIMAKNSNRGRSGKNVATLEKSLNSLKARLGDVQIKSVSPAEIDSWLNTFTGSARTRLNNRRVAVTFFRWAQSKGYLPEGRKTAPEKSDKPITIGKVPETYTPAEMRKMLDVCPLDYLPWIVLAGLSGLRQEELIADDDSAKEMLDWSDIHWDRDLIIVRPETAKGSRTGARRRVIPLFPAVRAWLEPLKKDSGPICPQYAPFRSKDRKSPTLTKRLGTLVGGWRTNALRHSFISYRAAIVGLGRTAMEAGNSETEAKKSYNDAKGEDEANAWFSLMPSEHFRTKHENRWK